MITLLYQGHVLVFALILIALIISLSFHEFGHAYTAKLFGDDTAERAGRLTINPIAHIDPMGMLMVIFVGFGYAKPVPTDPRNFTSRWADLWVSAAGPGMNLLVAIVAINIFVLGDSLSWPYFSEVGTKTFFVYLAQINLLLMIFNLIPIGALDGHYILPYFLPRKLSQMYRYYNDRYGNYVLLSLLLVSVLGIPVFQNVFKLSQSLLPWIIFV
ncbi:MAG: site-2 protease family protein [Gammaproteobacteria bacterium]|nr:site-2 protease family protein [Gammaproteobacteria bacterium]MDH3465300.1 site-2 protease family protein [Gammaproteobacteria bacterium]